MSERCGAKHHDEPSLVCTDTSDDEHHGLGMHSPHHVNGGYRWMTHVDEKRIVRGGMTPIEIIDKLMETQPDGNTYISSACVYCLKDLQWSHTAKHSPGCPWGNLDKVRAELEAYAHLKQAVDQFFDDRMETPYSNSRALWRRWQAEIHQQAETSP